MRGGPVKAWLALLFVAPVTLVQPPSEAPPNCERLGEAWSCRWTVTTQEVLVGSLQRADLREDSVYFPLPVLARSLVTITVHLDGAKGGWSIWIDEDAAGAWEPILHHESAPGEDPSRDDHTELNVHYVEANESRAHRFSFTPHYGLSISQGSFVIQYLAEPVPWGIAPSRPAATRDDPHIADSVGDASVAALDVVAAWLDDERLGDGIFDAHLVVANASDLSPLRERRAALAIWTLAFEVRGRGFELRWLLESRCEIATGAIYTCNSHDGDFSASRLWCYLVDAGGYQVTNAPCTLDLHLNEFVARVPESALGEPAPGEVFTELVASSTNLNDAERARWDGLAATRPADSASPERYPFALGGPAVWDKLNPRLAVPPEPWYVHPLAAESIPNTLQVLGALVAVSAFVAGLVLVRHRRGRLHALLDEVDALAARHERDAGRGLLALGDLQTDMSHRVRRGGITEAHYQIVSQRIAFVASQLAVRRDLGLDDGVPGEKVGVKR